MRDLLPRPAGRSPRTLSLATPARRLARFGRSAGGNISVEFALVLPFLILLILGATDFGRGFVEKLRLNNAARAGAQYALANHNKETAALYAGVEQSAQDDAEDLDQILDVDPNIYCKCLDGTELACGQPCSGGEVPMRYIEVDVSGPFEFLFDYPTTTGSMTLSGHAELRLR
jgi:hypothetical protein